jgi:valyl-tRNA synthetase
VDEKGYKMSKSKGNGIDPHDILEKFGAEPFRLWAAVEGNLEKTDFRCSFERIENAGTVLVKLWNVSKFISMFELTPAQEKNAERMEIDKWILGEAHELEKFARQRYEKYDFHNPAVRITNFVKNEFASHYVEVVKRRAYNNDAKVKFSEAERNAAVKTLREVLKIVLEIMAPINPAINQFIYKELFGKNIHEQKFPETKEFKSKVSGKELEEFNSAIWKAKKDANLSLKDAAKEAVAPQTLKNLEAELKLMHNIQKISYGKTKITI